MRSIYAILIFVLVASTASKSQTDVLRFTENKGQWNSRAQYRVRVGDAYVFLEKDRFTYLHYDRDALLAQHANPNPPKFVQHHAVYMRFLGSNTSVALTAEENFPDYENYFIDNDASKWATNVQHYRKVKYTNLYHNIDVETYSESGFMKYDFRVHPGGNPNQILLLFEHADKIWLENGQLHIKTSVGVIKEQAPIAYQRVDGFDQLVPCKFTLKNNTVGFEFPDGYDKTKLLVIDPILVFSTFTGSTADNFGFTATYDDNGNAFGGGVVFSNGQYPVTPGAFQISFQAGGGLNAPTDIGITKFSTNGNNLLYSTYIGGSMSSEAPHSLITDDLGNLYVLGTTGSANFPTTAGSYNSTFNGGTPVSPQGSGLVYNAGSDIFVLKLNSAGTALLSSTFVGGTGNDGLNTIAGLRYFYGDDFRGEIGLDAAGNVYCISTTQSMNFPVTAGAAQTLFGGGGSDAVIFKMTNDLSSLLWSSYLGGAGTDAGFGLQFDSAGDLYLAGGTNSIGLPTTPGVIGPSFSGVRDGFLARLDANSGAIIAATYLGTPAHDLVYFIQLDLNDDVYLLGVTEGTYPVTPGKYANNNSWQFIHKINNTFTTSHWSTVVGSGTNVSNFSPTAFLVDNCGYLYLAGWGGTVNGLNPPNSNTTGCPVTFDATQSFTDGSDFYLMVLDQNATTLEYATFFGGGVNEHVDGGTSRFDKRGRVYQSVCAGCGGSSAFPTTPGVWSNTNNSTNCNMALFKYDLRKFQPIAQFVVDTVNCALPATAVFTNQSQGAQGYIWNFGDGSPEFNGYSVIHNYQNSGVYNVMLIALDPYECFVDDTAFLAVYIPQPPTVNIIAPDSICPGEDVQLSSDGLTHFTYLWSITQPANGTLTPEPFVPAPSASFSAILQITDTSGCVTSDTAIVIITPGYSITAGISSAYEPCSFPNPVLFNNTSVTQGSGYYYWDFGDGSPTSEIFSPSHTYTTDGNFTVQLIAIDSFACNAVDTTTTVIQVVIPPTVSILPPNPYCPGGSTQLEAIGLPAYQYLWSPLTGLSQPTIPNPIASPGISTLYYVVVTDVTGCTAADSIQVVVFPDMYVDAGPNVTVPIGSSAQLLSTIPNATTVLWVPSSGLSCSDCVAPFAAPSSNTLYYVYVTDTSGCMRYDSVMVYVEPTIYVPNAFTPNQDGMNDQFKAIVRGIDSFEWFIYDRWGQLVFTSTDPEEAWDGTYKGNRAPFDVYVWKIKYTASNTPGIIRTLVGHVTLVR